MAISSKLNPLNRAPAAQATVELTYTFPATHFLETRATFSVSWVSKKRSLSQRVLGINEAGTACTHFFVYFWRETTTIVIHFVQVAWGLKPINLGDQAAICGQIKHIKCTLMRGNLNARSPT